ncbi:putative glycosyltransferase [Catenovulum agarivorans DS-2]|uniref:Putative glycosyltransferase n=1 Tax=Catenovulum agarivorans DS-2 TaxID=1328313 RepID=W7QSC5_9ALTE|nr:glycosyltransferase family 8 protein [Catenovulum agarivorans]EWH10763.1 putative glycosyltransferase [Catenovulum agarivorans DS-2]
MKKIPIVFAFDDNLILQAGVCFSSLLDHAHSDTFYEIYVLYCDLLENNQNLLKKLNARYDNFSLKFIDCSREFFGGFETRGITKSTYLRLWIPKLLNNYRKVLYFDVDIIFRTDLTKLYEWDIGEACFAGVKSPEIRQKYSRSKGWGSDYINAGMLIINNERISEDDVEKACSLAINDCFKFQDQDIINNVFSGRIYSRIPRTFNFTPSVYKTKLKSNLSDNDIGEPDVIHYVGAKPWNASVFLGEYWWSVYINSIWYENTFYHKYCRSSRKLPPIQVILRYLLKSLFSRKNQLV